MVSDEVRGLASEGGVAEKARQATAVAADKVQTAVDKVKPVASEAARKTGEAVNKGAYATGRQIARSKTMFSDFKEEYDKARGSKSSSKPSSKSGGTTLSKASSAPRSSRPKRKPKSVPPRRKNMFAAFKEEYDKARHED